jgi:hypothetical protein
MLYAPNMLEPTHRLEKPGGVGRRVHGREAREQRAQRLVLRQACPPHISEDHSVSDGYAAVGVSTAQDEKEAIRATTAA